MCTVILVMICDPTMPLFAIIRNIQVVDVEPYTKLKIQLLCKIKRYLVIIRITIMCS